MKHRVLLAILAVLLALALAGIVASADAEVPRTVSYQGLLRNADGTLVPNGNYQLTFRLYGAAAGGTALWTELQTVPVAEGVCAATLGSVTVLDLPFDTPYWLGVSVGANPELTPRVALTAVPFALRAAVADSVPGMGAGAGGWVLVGDDLSAAVSGGVAIGAAHPDTSALLELSGTRGFLPPRMTQAERNAIPSPKDGLLIYNTDTSCLNYFAGGLWLALCGDCVPDCAGKECGADGCGGSCGTCPDGMHCEGGHCVCDLDECVPADSYCAELVSHRCVEQPAGCGHWVVEDCNDGNPCTIDTCDPATGCAHTPAPNGTSCGPNQICVGGNCVSCANNGGPLCGSAYYYGQMCGDQGTYSLNQGGCGSGWFQVLLQECEGGLSLNDLQMRVNLQSPAGDNYDLYVYSPCGNQWGQSTQGPGLTDTVLVTVEDELFSTQDTYFWIEVRTQSVTNNQQWYLQAIGNP